MEYKVGDKIFITSTNIQYEVVEVDTKSGGYVVTSKKDDEVKGRRLYMSQKDMEDVFETIVQQRASKLKKIGF